MKIKLRYVILVILVIMSCLAYTGKRDKEAMEVCQEKHSKDTCFHTIYN